MAADLPISLSETYPEGGGSYFQKAAVAGDMFSSSVIGTSTISVSFTTWTMIPAYRGRGKEETY